jgi:hypothetical protein
MLTKYLQYFIAFIISSCFTVQAMDSHQNFSEEALEELNKIVCHSFPLPQYHPSDLLFIKSETALTGKENAGVFENMDEQTTVLLMHPLSPRVFLNFGQTCQYLHALSLSPCFYLNEFCLQEGMPRSMPVDILVSKAMRTENGIINLATLYSVSEQELKKWFKKSDLEQALQRYGTLPASVEKLDNTQIAALLPVVKIAFATEPKEKQMTAIRNLLYTAEVVPSTSSLYPSCQILKLFGNALWFPQQVINDMESGKIPYNHQTIDVFTHDLLSSPQGIPFVVRNLKSNPKKSNKAIELIQWCSKYSYDLT